MSEKLNAPNHDARQYMNSGEFRPIAAHTQEFKLSHQSVQITELPILSKQEAVTKYGINGDILAMITLPAHLEEREDDELKKIALIDFGPDVETNPTAIVADRVTSKEYKILGTAQSRYGLIGLNYRLADTPLLIYEPLKQGDNVYGRLDLPPHGDNSRLALFNTPENAAISREHFTVSLTEDGVFVRDHSLNGTVIEIAQENESGYAASGDTEENTGYDSRQNAERPAEDNDGLIDHVPSTEEIKQQQARAVERQREAAGQRMREIDARIEVALAGLSENQKNAALGYARAFLYKEDAQQRGDGAASTYYGQESWQYFNGMSREARDRAEEVVRLMRSKGEIR